ncbi:LacI family DNA-binding transcriptional regulator [Nereida sp. MMG025]|uniref:LacI family DNA-binding transcriptional regulator n=1 Tax=Nereida sp. MMG025 TaxID=2909981 RepID=UPI001F3A340E|nr:LacI family DNA-binding transcriptional regulator [Nereida sp. MMG025]MCF6445590.1 LacI family transcriptional regulator [Nereida sp. MMG025]
MATTKIRNMEEFAEVSGVSRPTLSKYFHDPDSVRASTRDKIEKKLAEFNYRPNIYAMNQNRKLTNNIGIVVPYLADPVFAEFARTIELLCHSAGYRPTVFTAHGHPEEEVEILEALRAMKPAGLLMAPLGRASDRLEIERFCDDIPTVFFDSELSGLDVPFVGADNPQFTRTMVEYLCRTGSPPCFFEMKTPANPNARKRRNSYIETMEANGHDPQIIQADGEGWSFEEIGLQAGLKAFEDKAFTSDTILCSNDRIAIGLLTAAYEKGITVGLGANTDIRIAGQDDHPFSRFTCPPLTTIAQDFEAISRQSFDLLMAKLNDQEIPMQNSYIEGKLIMRDSA